MTANMGLDFGNNSIDWWPIAVIENDQPYTFKNA